MSLFGDFVDSVGDAVSDVGGSIADAAEAVGQGAADAAGAAGGYVGDAAGAVGSAIDMATFGGASSILGGVDDTLFDGVDYLTGGVVNIDFDDGRFGASVGIDGVTQIGASIGEQGLTATFDTGIASTDIGLTDSGFQFDTTGGVDFGPLPYYDGHVEVSPSGEVEINGHVQGTVPTPYGLLSGEASGGFVKTGDGWGTFIDADGTLTLPSGTTIGAGIQAGYMEQGDDSRATFGLEGSISEPGVGSAGGSFGYSRTEHDGNVVVQEHAEGHAEGFGVSVTGQESYLGIDTAQGGSFSQWTSDFDVKGLDADSLTQLGQSLLGADDGELAGALGSIAASGSLGDLIGNLDSDTTSALVARVAGLGTQEPAAPAQGGAAAPSPGLSIDDDVLGAVAPATPGLAAIAAVPSPEVTMQQGPVGADAMFDAPADAVDGLAPTTSSPPTDIAPPDAVDDLGQAVAAADQIDQDTDAMFNDLGT